MQNNETQSLKKSQIPGWGFLAPALPELHLDRAATTFLRDSLRAALELEVIRQGSDGNQHRANGTALWNQTPGFK